MRRNSKKGYFSQKKLWFSIKLIATPFFSTPFNCWMAIYNFRKITNWDKTSNCFFFLKNFRYNVVNIFWVVLLLLFFFLRNIRNAVTSLAVLHAGNFFFISCHMEANLVADWWWTVWFDILFTISQHPKQLELISRHLEQLPPSLRQQTASLWHSWASQIL